MDFIQKVMGDVDFIYVPGEDMGPSQWLSLHNIARTLTPDKMEAFKEYVRNMAILLPCGVCSSHFRQLVADTLKSNTPAEAMKWTIDVHNAVNKRLGKPVLSYEDAVEAIKQNSKKLSQVRQTTRDQDCCPTVNAFGAVFLGLFIILAIVLLVLLVVQQKRRKSQNK